MSLNYELFTRPTSVHQSPVIPHKPWQGKFNPAALAPLVHTNPMGAEAAQEWRMAIWGTHERASQRQLSGPHCLFLFFLFLLGEEYTGPYYVALFNLELAL